MATITDEKMTTWNWDDPLARMPGETLRAWAALLDYEAMGAGRSLPLLAKGYRDELPADHVLYPFFERFRGNSGGKSVEKPPSRRPHTVEGWSANFDWQARLTRLEEIRIERREAIRLQRQIEIDEKDWCDGEELRKIAREFLAEFPKFKTKSVQEKSGPDGETVHVIVQELNTSFQQLSQAVKIASELQRHAVDKPDFTIELSGGSLLNTLIKELDGLVAGAEGEAPGDADDAAAT